MLTKAENERLTRVGPGTPTGELMRRYWHPIAASTQLDESPTKAIRLLGEHARRVGDRFAFCLRRNELPDLVDQGPCDFEKLVVRLRAS